MHISTLVEIQTFMILVSKSSEQTYLGFLCLCVGNLRHGTRVGASRHRGARAEGDDRGGGRSFTAVASHCCQATHYCNHCNIERSWGYAQPALPPGKERGWGEVEGWPLASLRGWCTNLHFSLCLLINISYILPAWTILHVLVIRWSKLHLTCNLIRPKCALPFLSSGICFI